MYDFSKFYLNFIDKTILFFLRFKTNFKLNQFPNARIRFCEYGLIKPNSSGQKNQIGEAVPDGTYSKTDLYRKYSIYCRMEFYRSFFFPLIVAVITSLIVNAITM